MPDSLVQPLFEGPLDIVGDVHGEIAALRELIKRLGYDSEGSHADRRRLVFVGDLVDRGPDSPAVIDFVSKLVASRRAQCVLGNHEFNILMGARKHDNHWFFGEPWSLDGSSQPTPATLADEPIRRGALRFFGSLPLVLERAGLRVVHACWDEPMVDLARRATNAITLYDDHAARISARTAHFALDEVDRELEHQNLNPVKVLTSGKERRTPLPFVAGGKTRHEERVAWWKNYDADDLCVFGHYSFFRGGCNSSRRAICIDYAVAKRWMERKEKKTGRTFQTKLAALRVPEMTLVFDDGETEQVTAE